MFVKRKFTRGLESYVTQLMNRFFWKTCFYWAAQSPQTLATRGSRPLKLRVAYLKGWYAFMFSYQPSVNELFRQVDLSDRYFFSRPVNGYCRFAGWLIRECQFKALERQLEEMPEVKLVYVVEDGGDCPKIPSVFQGMTFKPVFPRR